MDFPAVLSGMAQLGTLTDLPERVEVLAKQKRLVACGGGYRSAIAASILARAGIESFANVLAGTVAEERWLCRSDKLTQAQRRKNADFYED